MTYDQATELFTKRIQTVAQWKHVYGGAAYTTRLVSAIRAARSACNDLEAFLREEGEITDEIR